MKNPRLSYAPEDLKLAARLKALAHPARLAILRALITRPETACCGEIVANLPLAQSTVSEHLRVLCDAGLIACDPVGTKCCYRPVPDTLSEIAEAIGGLEAISLEAV